MAFPKLVTILAFNNVNAGAQATLAHGLNLGNGKSVKPDLLLRDNADFSIVAVTTTQVTVQNDGGVQATLQLWCEHLHSIPREIGAGVDNMSPQPFVPAAGGGTISGTIDVQDEGTPLGSFATLNFIGAGVTATDAGGGVADLTIPGGGGAPGVDLENGGVPLAGGPFTTLNLTGATATDAGGGVADVVVASSGGGDRTWYGNGVDGNLVVLTGTVVTLDAHRAYDNVTIQTGAMLYGAGYDLRVADTFTTEGTGTYEASGGNGADAAAPAGAAIHGNGGVLGTTVTTKSGYTVPGGYTISIRAGGGSNGGDGSIGAGAQDAFAPNNQLRTASVRSGGSGGPSDSEAGGQSLGPGGNPTDCYATPAIATGLDEEFDDPITGGIGGGGGGGVSEGGGKGGAGGGGGGILKLYARNIVAVDGSIKSTGGNGGAGIQASGGGGGGGQGGIIFIITDGPFDPAVKCDVTGGAGGAGSGTGANGNGGDLGEVVALSPILGPL